ncbi:hypothetical protein [Halorientalis regularis]|uniref:Uncharacterized protein n=1 Tax=Halorientalis regularis TaxID=660518 RepID=A0A1G7TVY8_9EURY|nr:hypothetical protein [Halorientalis regularis]SDG38670.1 hypothetical protein SAMN05216218_1304 [Halorientalis regularis]
MSMNNLAGLVQENREKLKLLLYFAVIIALAYPLATSIGKAWESSHLARSIVRLHYVVGVSRPALNMTILGLFIGLLTLMTLDPKKRIQAALLWLGMIISLVGLLSLGLFLVQINFIAELPWFIGGLILGLVIGGGRKLLQVQTADALEFRRASLGIFFILALIVVVAFVEYHVQYPKIFSVTQSGVQTATTTPSGVGLETSGIFKNALISGLFIVVLGQFVTYDAEHDFFILGPRASGKSLFLIGAYLEALEQTSDSSANTPLNPSNDLVDMMQELDRPESEWIIEATGRGEVNVLSFQFVHGRVFPTNIGLQSIDYAGEYLNRLPDAIADTLPDDSVDSTLERLVDGVETADTLVLLLDLERFMNDEPLEITEYFDILRQADNTGVILVATKADVMAEEFREKRGLEAHRYQDEFRQYINQRLRGSQQVEGLIQETAGTEIYPVYYQTKVNENGDRVPIRDETNSVTTVGYDELLDLLGRRA